MPHKVKNFMSLVDDVMPEARENGAINTIFTRVDRQTGKNRLLGTNTDYIGIGQSFLTLPSFTEQHTASKGGGQQWSLAEEELLEVPSMPCIMSLVSRKYTW
jgi:shikimate 5-dehydrogenase